MRKFARYTYFVIASLFLLGILTQVYFIGLSLLGGRPSFDDHIGLGHMLGGLVLLMVIFAYIGRLPSPVKPLTWLNLVVYILIADVVIFMRDSAPLVASLHPVLAVILFANTASLAVRAWKAVREPVTAVVKAAPQYEPVGVGDK
jgi:hypothetical protein